MSEKFKRLCYDNFTGFQVHHTTGYDASSSTLGYLHYDTNLLFMYFKKGTGKIIIEGRHYTIEEEDVVILCPSELYLCTIDENVEHERISIYVNDFFTKNFNSDLENFLQLFYKRKKGEGNFIKAQTVKELNIDCLFEKSVVYAKSLQSADRVMAACKVMEILSVVEKSLPVTRKNVAHKDPLTERILNFINEHFTEDISITEISEHFYMDKYNFCHFFKKQVGVSAWNYIIFRRLNYCNELIKRYMPIDEASYRAGFRNYSNFFRLYKKYMGITPMEFKKQNI